MTEVKDYSSATARDHHNAATPAFQLRNIQLTAKNADEPLEILFLGDTSFGENYQQRLKATGRENILKSKGYEYPLAKMASLLGSTDLVVANLETPITDIETSPFAGKKSYVHWTDVVKAPEQLLKHHITAVSLANNHTFDYGREGFNQTLSLLDKAKIHYFGADRDQQSAGEPLRINGSVAGQSISLAIIGAFQESASYRRDYQAYAEGNNGGVNPLHIDAIIKNIRAIKAYNPDTFVIVFPHWGSNYAWKSTTQTNQAQALIESGADLILGHGAHMLQEIECYNNKWIAYSLGNFMFNSPGRYAHFGAPPYSLVAKLCIQSTTTGLIVSCRLYPIVSDNKQTQYQTRFVTTEEFGEICELFTSKNEPQSSLLQTLARNQDQHGYYLELPLNTTDRSSSEAPAALRPAASSQQIGYICNLRGGITPGKTAKKWMYRALAMSKALQKDNIELFIYAYNHIDRQTGTVQGYIIENDQFVKKTAAIPQVNYDWFLGPKVHIHDRPFNYAQFTAWAEKNNRAVYPHQTFMNLAKDKLLSYQTLAEFDPHLGIYTETYNNKLAQLERFLQKSSCVFLKPQFGNSGIGIIVIKKLNNHYTLTHYEQGQNASLTFSSAAEIYAQANTIISNTDYIIQPGIMTERLDSSTFDIRLVVIGQHGAWKIIPEVRLGAKNSDLSNVAQGGSCIELDLLLQQLSNKLNPTQFKNKLEETILKLTSFLDAYQPSALVEMAYDIIIDTQQKIHITEINCKPGSPMIFRSFNNMFKLDSEEQTLYANYIAPHGTALAEIMATRLRDNHAEKPVIWFDSQPSPLELSTADKNQLLKEIFRALQQKNSLNRDNLPSAVIEDTAPRLLFLSISNGFSKAQVALATGLGLVNTVEQALTKLPALHKHNFHPIWIKLDIITDTITHHNVDFNKPLSLERSLSGIAFTHDINMAFLPEQLTTYTLVTSKGELHRRNIGKYVAANPYLHNRFQKLKNLSEATLFEFKAESLYYDGETVLPLYRGHRLINELSKEQLLDAADLAVDYLIRAVGLDGKFVYSYEPKIDYVNTTYNILRHSGTLYSMLEVYEITRDESILNAAQRAIRYLVEQLHETVINNETTLVVLEGGFLKLGGNGLAALALAKYTQLTQDDRYLPLVQKLAAWIVNSQSPQGEFTIHKQAYNAEIIQGFDSEYYPGEALFALARLYQLDPQPRWLQAAVNGALFLINVRDKDLPMEKLNHDHWLLYALNEIHHLQAHPDFLTHATKITEVIISRQRSQSRFADWIGSYYNPPRSTPGATRLEGLCASYQLATDFLSAEQATKILAAIKSGVRFQLQTQFHPESVLYLPNPQRALGAFHCSLTDFEIRIDYVQHNISCLLGLYKILNQA